eukprot:453630-Rhodomonas_salina.6
MALPRQPPPRQHTPRGDTGESCASHSQRPHCEITGSKKPLFWCKVCCKRHLFSCVFPREKVAGLTCPRDPSGLPVSKVLYVSARYLCADAQAERRNPTTALMIVHPHHTSCHTSSWYRHTLSQSWAPHSEQYQIRHVSNGHSIASA